MTTLLFISLPKLSIILIAGGLYLYCDYRYCTHADFRNGLVVERIVFWYTKIFYRITYIRNPDISSCGYYLTKRAWLWVLFLPVSLTFTLARHLIWETFDYIENLFYYENICVQSEEKHLSGKDKNDLIKKLIK